MRPVVGLPAWRYLENYDHALTFLGAGIRWLRSPGEDLSGLSGLVLPGGKDIEPCHYGQEKNRCTITDPERDALEFGLLARFLPIGRPVLGICRGIQLINAALGGTLIQDIGTELGIYHPNGKDERHPITVAPGSFVARHFVDGGEVNSTHHQAVGRLAPGLTPVAWCGPIIEAVEGDNIWAVQWHPEKYFKKALGAFENPAMEALLWDFVERCAGHV